MVPEEADFVIEEMEAEECAERELQSRRIHESRNTLAADTHWTSASNTVFDGPGISPSGEGQVEKPQHIKCSRVLTPRCTLMVSRRSGNGDSSCGGGDDDDGGGKNDAPAELQ